MDLKQTAFQFIEPAASGDANADMGTMTEQEKKLPVLNDEQELLHQTGESSIKNAEPKKPARGRMKLKDMQVNADLVDIPADEILFQKSYYSIGKVSEMFKVNISLIRFWENEFDILKPKKNSKGDRFFRPEDVKNLQLIYLLLREKKYTIEGAKEFLKRNNKAEAHFLAIESLKKLKLFLQELKANL